MISGISLADKDGRLIGPITYDPRAHLLPLYVANAVESNDGFPSTAPTSANCEQDCKSVETKLRPPAQMAHVAANEGMQPFAMPTNKPRFPATCWQAPTQLDQYCRSVEARYLAALAGRTGEALYTPTSLLHAIAATPLAHNRAQAWRLVEEVLDRGNDPGSVKHILALCTYLRTLDEAWEHSQDRYDDHRDGRIAPPGYDPRSHNKANLGHVVPLGKRPVLNGKTLDNAMARTIRFEKARLHAKVGHYLDKYGVAPVTIDVRARPWRRTIATNAVTWYSNADLQFAMDELTPEARSFIDAHYTGIDPATQRKLRCSNVRRLDGRPIFRTPDGRAILLGPFYKSIEGQRNRRQLMATPANPDPLLWPAANLRQGMEVPMTCAQHRQHLHTCSGRRDIGQERLSETGLAYIAMCGAPAEYMAYAQGYKTGSSATKMEDLRNRALLHLKAGTSLHLGPPSLKGAAPGHTICAVCFTEQPTALHCNLQYCMSPLGDVFSSPLEQRRWQVHRLLDAVLASRGETQQDRDRLLEDSEVAA